jgi:hypothetical protein
MKNHSTLFKYVPFVLVGLIALANVHFKATYLSHIANLLIYALICCVAVFINAEHKTAKTKTALVLNIVALVLRLTCSVIWLLPRISFNMYGVAGIVSHMSSLLIAVSFVVLSLQFKDNKYLSKISLFLAVLLFFCSLPVQYVFNAIGLNYWSVDGQSKAIIYFVQYALNSSILYVALLAFAVFSYSYYRRNNIREIFRMNALDILSMIYIVIAVTFFSALWGGKVFSPDPYTTSSYHGGGWLFPVVSLGIAVMISSLTSIFIKNRIMTYVSCGLLVIWSVGACITFFKSMSSLAEYYIYSPVICTLFAFAGSILLIISSISKR